MTSGPVEPNGSAVILFIFIHASFFFKKKGFYAFPKVSKNFILCLVDNRKKQQTTKTPQNNPCNHNANTDEVFRDTSS
jgi:hypothetical protein